MIVSFDASNGEVSLDLENGLPEISLPLGRLVLKYYSASAGALVCVLEGATLEVSYWPLPDAPSRVEFEPLDDQRWRVRFLEERPEE